MLGAVRAALARAEKKIKVEVLRRVASDAELKKSRQQSSILLTQSVGMQRELRYLSHQLLSAQEDERRTISRELHDSVGQTLVGIHLNLASLSKSSSVNTKGLKKKITSTQQMVQRSMKSVQRFARQLRPAQLDDLGLVATLHAYLKEYSLRTGIRVGFNAFAGADALGSEKRTVLYRVVQEALNNVSKHARATQVTVRIKPMKQALLLEVSDNGRAFSVQRVMAGKEHRRLGLLGMRERIEMIRGQFSVESVPGRGTRVCAQIPFRTTR